MPIPVRDANKIRNLVKEGKQISRILAEDFPDYGYWEIYAEAYSAGEISALGVKRMITNRLNQLVEASGQRRQDIIDELDDLVWYLYNNYKSSQSKLDSIRQILG